MKRRTLLLCILPAPLLGAGQAGAQSAAPPIELAGVRYAPGMLVAGRDLVLNGAGIRYKFFIKVYTAGLYLTAKAATTEAVLATPGPKRMHVVMLRDIDANELGRLFTRGLQDNAPREEFGKFIPGTLRLGELFAARKKLLKGDSFDVDWIPGAGTVVLVNGQPQNDAIKEPEFYNALLRIWLGPSPAERALKDALLGNLAPNPGDSSGQH